ncbi:MAG: hypothetical protein ABF633_13995 [Clostridium sp.]|uniref:hypothetical protein n=1 Tax=Clostridium sp. TaxID=1506 RepID=UPI0039E79959
MDIGNRFLNILNDSFENSKQKENFIICPKAFYSGLTEREISAMQELYSRAYAKALEQVKKKKNKYGDFFNGSGI